jgi:2-hydroxy-6-oxonona-2,4-dienedioate hydrolase
VSGSDLGAAAAAWAATTRVEAGGTEIRYREAGAGLPVVLVHGLGMASDYWARTGPALAAAGYRVLAPDLPGFGESEGAEGGLPPHRQAEVLREWADVLRLGAAVYIGHSLSCQSVVELAAATPRAVLALVLTAPTGEGGRGRMVHEAIGLARDAWHERARLVVLAAHAYLRAGPKRFWQTWRAGADREMVSLLPRIAVPVLVVVGDQDPVVSTGHAGDLVRRTPRGELCIVPGGTHAVFHHDPERYNRAVLEFLAKRVGEPTFRPGAGGEDVRRPPS